MTNKEKIKFRIFAGVNNEYRGIHEFFTEDEALEYAHDLAVEDVESYDGMHGLPCRNNYQFDPDDEDTYEFENWTEEDIETEYLDELESILEYDVLLVEEGVEYDSDGDPVED